MEIVIILGDVCEDAQPVGHLQRYHILSVQQGRDPQLLFSHLKCLQWEHREQGSVPAQSMEMLYGRRNQLKAKQHQSK